MQSTSISLAHNEGVASITLRQAWHTCDVLRVILRASVSTNISAFIETISDRMSSLRMKIGGDSRPTDILGRKMGG